MNCRFEIAVCLSRLSDELCADLVKHLRKLIYRAGRFNCGQFDNFEFFDVKLVNRDNFTAQLRGEKVDLNPESAGLKTQGKEFNDSGINSVSTSAGNSIFFRECTFDHVQPLLHLRLHPSAWLAETLSLVEHKHWQPEGEYLSPQCVELSNFRTSLIFVYSAQFRFPQQMRRASIYESSQAHRPRAQGASKRNQIGTQPASRFGFCKRPACQSTEKNGSKNCQSLRAFSRIVRCHESAKPDGVVRPSIIAVIASGALS